MKDIRNREFDLYGVKFKSFINLNDDEKKLVLSWRNDIRIRNLMFNKDIISLDSHLEFIENLKIRQDKHYWLVIIDSEYIGSVCLYNIEKTSCYWGYYVKPDLLGKSYGVVLEYLILKIVFEFLKLDVLRCETLKLNKSVVKYHKKFGFKEVFSENEIILMEIGERDWREKKDKLTIFISKLPGYKE